MILSSPELTVRGAEELSEVNIVKNSNYLKKEFKCTMLDMSITLFKTTENIFIILFSCGTNPFLKNIFSLKHLLSEKFI